MAKEANKPAKKLKLGFLTATIWQNERFFNVVLARSYKEGDDFKETDQLGHADLLNAARLLTRAEQWISEQQ